MTVMPTSSTFNGLSPTLLKNAAGVAGNIFAFGLFLSPIPTFRRIMRNRSTEQFSGMPYIYALMNCLICLWYGSSYVSPDNILVLSVNSVGAVFQLTYSVIFVIHVAKAQKEVGNMKAQWMCQQCMPQPISAKPGDDKDLRWGINDR